jgi:dipeptidyl aminopeptidase/acylaminoacyl peptidase
MSPELDPYAPPHSAEELLDRVLARGWAIQRHERRRRIVMALGPAVVVLLVGLGAALTQGGGGHAHDRLTTAAGSTDHGTTTTTLGAADVNGGTLPAPQLGSGGPTITNAPVSTTSTTPAPTTTAPRVAPTAVFDLRGADGRYQTAVLRSGSFHPVAITAATAERQWPVLSPDGTKVAFASTQRNLLNGVRSIWDIYVVNVDGSGLRQITFSPLDRGYGSRWPSWSPDGSRLVASCANNTTSPSICTMQPDGRDVKVIGDGSYQLFWPRWAPDGSSIVALHQESSSTVSTWLLDPSGGRTPRRTAGNPIPFDGVSGPNWVTGQPALLIDQAGIGSVGQPSLLDPTTGSLTPMHGLAPGTELVACGASQVLYRTSTQFGPAKAGDLVLVGTDGSLPTVVLSKDASTNLIPTGCAVR